MGARSRSGQSHSPRRGATLHAEPGTDEAMTNIDQGRRLGYARTTIPATRLAFRSRVPFTRSVQALAERTSATESTIGGTGSIAMAFSGQQRMKSASAGDQLCRSVRG